MADLRSAGRIVPGDMKRRIIVNGGKVWHRLEAQTQRGYQLQAKAARDEASAALRCMSGDLRIALDAKSRAVCMHRTSQGPMRVVSVRLSVIDLKGLDEMIASDRYSTRNALALIPEHAFATTPTHSSIEFTLLNVDIGDKHNKALDWVRSVCLERNALTSEIFNRRW